MKFLKNTLLLVLILTLSTTVWAGGSIFGKHSSRTRNPDGIQSIGVHICGTLTCDKVVIRQGSCNGIENATMQYGVCLCDDGYHVENDKCVSDTPEVPINPEKECPEHATSCDDQGKATSCETGYTLNDGACEEVIVPPIPCPVHSICDEQGNVTDCEENYTLNNGVCEEVITPPAPTCPEHSVCDEQGNVTDCEENYTLNNGVCEEVVTPPAPTCPEHSICDEQGNVTSCEGKYYLNDNVCSACPDGNALTCGSNGASISCVEGYSPIEGFCHLTCPASWYGTGKESDGYTGGIAGNLVDGTECRCPANQVWYNEECNSIPVSCPEHATCDEQGNVMGCEEGWTGETCAICDTEHGWYPTGDSCVRACPDYIPNECMEQGPDVDICGQHIPVNKTGSCNGGAGTCVNGECVLIPCPEHATCDGQGNVTGCEDGYYFDNGTCVQTFYDCSLYNSGTHSHTPPVTMVDQCQKRGLVTTAAAGCWVCDELCREPNYTTIVNGVCQCADGFVFDGYGDCISCPENADCSDKSIIKCNDGFHPIYSGSVFEGCVSCPTNQIWNGEECVASTEKSTEACNATYSGTGIEGDGYTGQLVGDVNGGNCYCPDDHEWDGTSCVPCHGLLGGVMVDNHLVCNEGRTSCTCVQEGADDDAIMCYLNWPGTYVGNTGEKVGETPNGRDCNCPANQVWDNDMGRCKEDENAESTEACNATYSGTGIEGDGYTGQFAGSLDTNKSCYCPDNNTWNGENCTPCNVPFSGVHLVCSEDKTSCVCYEGENDEGVANDLTCGTNWQHSYAESPAIMGQIVGTLNNGVNCRCETGKIWDGEKCTDSGNTGVGYNQDNLYEWEFDPCTDGEQRCGFAPVGGSYFVVHCQDNQWENYGNTPCPFGCDGDNCASSCPIGEEHTIDENITLTCTSEGWVQ